MWSSGSAVVVHHNQHHSRFSVVIETAASVRPMCVWHIFCPRQVAAFLMSGILFEIFVILLIFLSKVMAGGRGSISTPSNDVVQLKCTSRT